MDPKGYKRTLNVERGDVGGKPTVLLFCFQVPDQNEIFKSQYPVAWRVNEFTGEGNEDIKATYKDQLFVSNPQRVDGNKVKPDAWIEISRGQKTELQAKGTGVVFKPPEAGVENYITVTNETGVPRDFGIGFVCETDPTGPTLLVLFPDKGEKDSISVEFNPILQAYVLESAQDPDTVVKSGKPFWTQDLRLLRDSSYWVFEKVAQSGEYSLRQVVSHEY